MSQPHLFWLLLEVSGVLTAIWLRSARREAPIDNKLPPRCFQHPVGITDLLYLLALCLNVLSLTFLELTTSTSDGKTPFGGEIVSHRKVLTASHSPYSTVSIWSKPNSADVSRPNISTLTFNFIFSWSTSVTLPVKSANGPAITLTLSPTLTSISCWTV